MNTNLLTAIEFFRRDWYVYRSRLPRYIVQYAWWYPTLFGLCWAYLVPLAGSTAQANTGAVIFVGTILFAFTPFAFGITADFLFDFEQDRFIDYQLILLPSWLILLQRILFSGFFIFVGLLPFIPFSKFIFSYFIALPYVSLGGTVVMLAAASLFVASFQIAFVAYAKGPGQIRHFWRRINYPMGMLGGFLIPWKVLVSFSPWVGFGVLINPYLYITEGLRSAILGGNQFFPWPLCVVALLIATAVSMGVATFFFKKKVDPVG